LALCALLAARAVFAQGDPFDDLIKTNTFPIHIQNGKLSGKGAELLESSLNDVQFVALGEEHNKRAVHEFGGALFRLLNEKYDFKHLALEEDAVWGKMLSEAAKKGGGEAVVKLALEFPNAFHLATENEMRMIGDVGKLSLAKNPIWGLNQVFGAAHVYARLVKIAPDGKARAVAERLLDQALEYEKERFAKNVHYLVAVARPEDFDALRSAFKPAKDSEAEFLIEQIALSNRIFAPYVARPRPSSAVFYESGKQRELNMKRLFAQSYRAAQKAGEKTPKVLAMFGQLHLYRGLSERTEQFTLGNYLSELANFNDLKSFHIYTAVDAEYVYKGAFARLAKIAAETAKNSDAAGALVDLRPLFDGARTGKEISPELRRLIMSYDVFLFLRDGATGSIERFRTPNYRWYPD
jgi:hypothetical protein